MSRLDARAQRLEALVADALDLLQLVDRPEAAVRLAVRDDARGERGADPVELLQLLGRRRAQADPGAARQARRRAGAVPDAPDAAGVPEEADVPYVPDADAPAVRDAPATPAAPRPRIGTTICWPSASFAAWLTAASSARGRGPPALTIAAATRDPSGRL
jgi:hypothetical protein